MDLIELVLTNHYAGSIAAIIIALISMLFNILKIRTSVALIPKIFRTLMNNILKRKEELMAEDEVNIKRKVVRIGNKIISTEKIERKKTTVLGQGDTVQ